jgi:hypothetical protein
MFALFSDQEIMMTHSAKLTDEKHPLLKSLLCAIFVGSFIGIFDMWAFQPSLKLFLAGQAAGIAFCSAFVFFRYLTEDRSAIFLITLIGFSGALAGLVWWLVADSSIPLWLAILTGGCVSNLIMWIDTGFKLETD